MANFIAYSLPRSRSYWLSKFLTYGDWDCTHDQLRFLRTPDDIKSWIVQPNCGTVETGAAPFWRLIPFMPTVVIRRPLDEVIASLHKTGDFEPITLRKAMEKLDHKLDQIERRVPNVLSVNYDDLNSEATCKAIFEKCLPYQHDHKWWKKVSKLNLQINMTHLIRYCHANLPQMEKLAKIVKFQMMSLIRPEVIDKDDGITIQCESFAASKDCHRLFEEHCVIVGEAPDSTLKDRLNSDLMQKLDDLGCLQIVTARSNGRMFGYLVSILAPSLESENTKIAQQTTMFASKLFPGLGMKMQRASIEFLKQRGVDEVYFRAGLRGDGERSNVLFKRVGAQPFGSTYKLNLT